MARDLKKELKYMKENQDVEEKLMIFSLYNEFYNEVMAKADTVLVESYEPLMETTFLVVATFANFPEEGRINAQKFMRIYFEILKKSSLSNIPQIKNIIKTYEKELTTFIKASKDVNIVDQFQSLSLDTKVDIMISFRAYINHIFDRIISLYEEEATEQLRRSLLDNLSIRLGNYLKDGLDHGVNPDTLKRETRRTTVIAAKDYLLKTIKDGELIKVQEEESKQILLNLSDTQQKIMLMEDAYMIAGYGENDKQERITETCRILGISRLRYTTTFITGILRSFKIIGDIDRANEKQRAFQKVKEQ